MGFGAADHDVQSDNSRGASKEMQVGLTCGSCPARYDLCGVVEARMSSAKCHAGAHDPTKNNHAGYKICILSVFVYISPVRPRYQFRS